MKHKILLTGTHHPLISDFFNHMDFSFELLSSSTRTDDILGHIKYYEPDALAYCLNKESLDDIRSFRIVINQLDAGNIPLILIGEKSNCASFEKIYPVADYLTIVRPFSTKELTEKISSHLDAHYEKLKKTAAAQTETQENANDRSGELTDALTLIGKITEQLDIEQENISAKEQKPAALKPAEPEPKKHILIVDDDSRVLKLVKNILSDRYNVATAISGKVAMKFLENKETDLVLLDYEMPGESGADILQKIRGNARFQKLPVVFLTGVTEKERIQQVLSFSPQGYLLKPINAERLNDTIEDIFKKK